MRLWKISFILQLLFSVCIVQGKTEKAPPQLEIISATYGKGAQSADITETLRKAVKGGTFLEFHNHPRWTKQNLKIRNSDKVIRLVYKLGGEKKKLECAYNGRIKIGELALKFQFGTPEWIAHFIDCSGGALALTFSGDPSRGKSQFCPKCKQQKCIAFLPFEEDHMQCAQCGFVFSDRTLPTTGADVFEDMKLEYHRLPDGEKIYWKPILRCMKAQYLYYEVSRMRKKDPDTARKRLDAMRAYAKFFKKHMVRGSGKKIFRPGYPHHCNWGRLTHFGDYVFPSSYCIIFRQIEESGIKITRKERAEYRALLEDIISEITLPFIRQWRGMGNPMGQAFADCIRTGRVFPEAKIVDYYTPDKEGNPRILSGTDLVYETVQGRNGLENLVSTYWYSDGLMHEPSVPYQGMLALGVTNTLKCLEGFEPPAGYDPAASGYQPFPKSGFLERPELHLPRNKHKEVVFQNGEAIPFGDGLTRMTNQTPPKESDLYHGWGIGALRHENTAAAMNWGNLNDGHSHNDMLNLIYWGDGLLMLNTTEYPANEPAAPIQYWRNGAGAHNTVMVDGKNHERARGGFGAWGVTDHLKMMQGFSDQSYPGAVLRRTAFLVNSRPGMPPYLVDFYQVDGGKESHDYFLQAQSRFKEPLEQLEVLSPKLAATGKHSLADVFADAEKKNVYPFIKNPDSGKFKGNAELLWMIPHMGAQRYLHAFLVPEEKGENTLYIGDAPGIRYTGRTKDPLDRTVKKVVWRREKGASEKTMRSCFMAAFEYADEKDRLDLKEMKRLNVSGPSASRAAEVTHGSGKDILLLSDATGRMSVNTSAGQIAFDGIAALLSLDRNGKLLKVTTTGLRSLSVNGKRIAGGCIIRGELAGVPSGLSEWLQYEKPATVTVAGRIPQEAVGNMLLVRHKNCTTSYKITGVRPLAGNRTELQLDRSARKLIAIVSAASDRRDLTILSGGGDSAIPGDNFVVDGKAYGVLSVDRSKVRRGAARTLGYATLKLVRPLPRSGIQRLALTEFGSGDPCTVMTSKTINISK